MGHADTARGETGCQAVTAHWLQSARGTSVVRGEVIADMRWGMQRPPRGDGASPSAQDHLMGDGDCDGTCCTHRRGDGGAAATSLQKDCAWHNQALRSNKKMRIWAK